MVLGMCIRVLRVLGWVGALGVVVVSILSINLSNSAFVVPLIGLVMTIFLMFGLIGSYLTQVEALGRIGILGFVVLIASVAWLIGMGWMQAFITPTLAKADPSLLNAPTPPYPVNVGFIVTGILLAVGFVLYGILLMVFSKAYRWPGLMLIISGVAGFVPGPLSNTVGPILASIAVVWMCLPLKSPKSVS